MPVVTGLALIRFYLCLALLLPAAACVARDLPDFAGLVREHGAEVVNISSLQHRAEAETEWSDEAPGPRTPEGNASLGSGFVISADGYVLTCAHVIEGADEIVVRLADRREYRARLVGADRRSDIALLKIDANGLRAVTTGDPGGVRVGDWVLAIGAPFGFDSSATSGIVSAIARSLPNENYVSFLQTDVAINPGNSGGPLFDLHGRVVGVTSQIYSRTGAFAGVSFAIPIDIAMRIADQLKRDGVVHRGWLGVRLQEVTHGLAAAYGLDRPRGALIAEIITDGPAARSALQAGDIVLEYEGRPIGLSGELPPLVGMTAPGTRARFRVFRRGAGTREVVVQVGELRDDPVSRVSLPTARRDGGHRLGLVLSEVAEGEQGRRPARAGLHVDDVLDGPAREAGVRVGDVIIEVDGRAVRDVAQFYRLMTGTRPDRPAVLRVRRGGSALYLALGLR